VAFKSDSLEDVLYYFAMHNAHHPLTATIWTLFHSHSMFIYYMNYILYYTHKTFQLTSDLMCMH